MGDASRREWLGTAGVMALVSAMAGTATAQARPNAEELIATVKGARVFDLSFVWNEQAPVLSLNPPYAFALNRTHKTTHEMFGQAPGSRLSWASDIMYFSGQHGAPTVDAIGHIGRDLKLYGGVDAVAATSSPAGIGSGLGIDHLPVDLNAPAGRPRHLHRGEHESRAAVGREGLRRPARPHAASHPGRDGFPPARTGRRALGTRHRQGGKSHGR